MPLYEYRCEACQHVFEVIQKFSDGPIVVCRSCGQGPVEKLPSSPAIQFKGTGWYITDYARKGQTGQTGGGTNSGKSEGGGGGDSAAATPSGDAGAKTESKNDNKTDSKSASKGESKSESKTADSSPKKD